MDVKHEASRPALPKDDSLKERKAFFEELANLLDSDRYWVPKSVAEYLRACNQDSAFEGHTTEDMIYKFIAHFSQSPPVNEEDLEKLPLSKVVREFERVLLQERVAQGSSRRADNKLFQRMRGLDVSSAERTRR